MSQNWPINFSKNQNIKRELLARVLVFQVSLNRLHATNSIKDVEAAWNSSINHFSPNVLEGSLQQTDARVNSEAIKGNIEKSATMVKSFYNL